MFQATVSGARSEATSERLLVIVVGDMAALPSLLSSNAHLQVYNTTLTGLVPGTLPPYNSTLHEHAGANLAQAVLKVVAEMVVPREPNFNIRVGFNDVYKGAGAGYRTGVVYVRATVTEVDVLEHF